jgi:hypothetical protein
MDVHRRGVCAEGCGVCARTVATQRPSSGLVR